MNTTNLLSRVARLVLPVLVPSWRFFDSIGPSPRIEYRVWTPGSLDVPGAPDDDGTPWTPWALTPETVGVGPMFGRLLFNAARNEALYLLACCERVVDEGSTHAEQQVASRLAAHVNERRLAAHVAAHVKEGRPAARHVEPVQDVRAITCLRFRIVEVFREGQRLQRRVAFESAVLRLDGPGMAK